MAHELYIDEGRASMMYAGDVPWHGLGRRVTGAATAAEAISAANLDWEVAKLPLFGTNGMHGVPVKGKYATVRADKIGKPDCEAFGIVGESYTPLQNKDAFSFFDSLIGENNTAMYHTAGALGIGERVWILAKLPGEITVKGSDITDKYLLLSNNHDGKAGIQIKFTPVRVVCNNTLSIALDEGGTLSVPHFRNVQERLAKAAALLGLIDKKYTEISESFNRLAEVKMNCEKIAEYLNAVFPNPQDPENISGLRKAEANRARAEYLFAQGKGNDLPGVAGTLWAAYNGITELIDHRVSASSGDSSAATGGSRRLNSIWFGAGAATKARAYEIAVEKLGAWRN